MPNEEILLSNNSGNNSNSVQTLETNNSSEVAPSMWVTVNNSTSVEAQRTAILKGNDYDRIIKDK